MKHFASVKKFYFLEYFYILLRSIEKNFDKEHVFESFKNLKHEYRLGESKYKKLTSEQSVLTKAQLNRYQYTFEQVIDEAKEYDLISDDNSSLFLTEKGRKLLNLYEDESQLTFNRELFKMMEHNYMAFHTLISFLYQANEYKRGLLIFPIYSPRHLGFDISQFRRTSDVRDYSWKLVDRLQSDIEKYLGKALSLQKDNEILLERLYESKLLSKIADSEFHPKKYNVITKRVRDFWLNFFLQKIYKFEFSAASFDIWVYRAKQIGIIHATEIYPNFLGRIVYPTSVILSNIVSGDFKKLYDYPDGKGLFIHQPDWERNQDVFVDYLVKAYYELRRTYMGYFINLAALREIVCYNMKISEIIFKEFLDKTYKLNLEGTLRIKISLEVDRLPEETTAMYLKREPVMVAGKYRNIIAIDVAKGVTNE